jgi:hypothetical protein
MIARGMAESEICHPHLLPSLIGLLQFQDTKANLQILGTHEIYIVLLTLD